MNSKQNSSECISKKLKQYENSADNRKFMKTGHGDSPANKDFSLPIQSSLQREASSGFEGSDLLVAEGIAAQQKRSALPSKTKFHRHCDESSRSFEALTDRITSLEDGLKLRESIISVLLKELGGGEASIDASVGPINTTVPELDEMLESSTDHLDSPKMKEVIQLLKNDSLVPQISSFPLSNQANEKQCPPDLPQFSFSAMESQLKEKESTIRELNLELARRSDIIEKNREDYSRQFSKTSCEFSAMQSQLREKESTIRELNLEIARRSDIIEKNREDYSRKYSKASSEIKNLKIKIEKLIYELHSKDEDLSEARDELNKTRNMMEDNFRKQFSCISDHLKVQHGDGESFLKSWVDDTIMRYIDSHENEIACYKKQIESLQSCIKELELSDHELEEELMACRLAHEAHASSYKEQVESLLKEMHSIKKSYQLQIEKFESEREYHREKEEKLEQAHNTENRALSNKFSELIENYSKLQQTYKSCRDDFEKANDRLKAVEEELAKKDSNEQRFLNEIKKYESTVEVYKKKIEECHKKCEDDCKRLELKHEEDINSLKDKLNYYSNERDRLQKEIEDLLNLSNGSLEEVKEIIVEHKYCKDKINMLNLKADTSEKAIKQIKQELLLLGKSHQDDVAKYKNQIIKLKEELDNMSSFEERLMIELSNHIQLKDDFKILFMQKEMEAYALDVNTSETVNLEDDCSGNQSYSLLSEQDSSENKESQGTSSGVNRRKCNISIQPHSNSNADKRRLREALIIELQTEMKNRKSELCEKDKLLECYMKAKDDLNEHCKTLEANFVELKNFTEEKIDEISSLNDEKKTLLDVKEQLESKMEALIEELSSRKAELDSINDLFDSNSDDTGARTLSFQMKRLFKNVPSSTPNVCALAANRVKSKPIGTPVKVHSMIVEQLSNFNDLERENGQLKKQIDQLTSKLKEKNDFFSELLRSFQEKTQVLENRLVILESEKKRIFQFERMIEQLTVRNKQLQESQEALQSKVVHLEEDNNILERECNEMKMKFALDFVHGNEVDSEPLENLIVEFSKKAEEALSLKEEMTVKQETINKLESELDNLKESKNNMRLMMDVMMADLMKNEERLTLSKQNSLEIGLEKRMLELKLVSMKEQYDQLLNNSVKSDEMIFQCSNISMNQETENEPMDMDSEAASKKQSGGSKLMNSGDWFDKDNVKRVLSAINNLDQEKEYLKQKIQMFEQFVLTMLDVGNRDDLGQIKDDLKELYEQLKASCDQFSMKTSNLKESEIEKLLEKHQCLQKDYKEMCNVLNSEKEELQKHVLALQQELSKMEENFNHHKVNSEREMRDKDLKIRLAELNLRACQVDSIASHGLASKSDSQIDSNIRRHFIKEMEKSHEFSMSKLKSMYLNQIEENNEKAENRIRAMEESYQSQIKTLQQDLNDKTWHLNEMKSKYLKNIFDSSVNEDLKTLADSKNGNCCNIEEITSRLREEFEREQSLLKNKVETQCSEEFRTKMESIEKKYKNDINTLQWIIGYEENGTTVEARSEVLLQRLLRLVKWEYKQKLESLSEAWNSKYGEYLSNLNRKLLELENITPKNAPTLDTIVMEISGKSEIEKIVSLKEKLIETSEEFYKFILEFHKTSLENTLTKIKDVHNEVSSKVDELRLELENGCYIASLTNKIQALEEEKRDLKSTIDLLSKDHETESVKVTKILKQSGILDDYVNPSALIEVEAKVEERLKKQYEEQFVKQRKYYENRVAELEKKLMALKTEGKTAKQDVKRQLEEFQDNRTLDNQSVSNFTIKDISKNNTNVENQLDRIHSGESKECLESNFKSEGDTINNPTRTALEEGSGAEEYLELARDEIVHDDIETYGLPWKVSNCDLDEQEKENNHNSSKLVFDARLRHLENEKRELERAIETLSKQNSVNDEQISSLRKQINEYKMKFSNKLCGKCKKQVHESAIDKNQNNDFDTDMQDSMKISECNEKKITPLMNVLDSDRILNYKEEEATIDDRYQYLFESLQKRIEVLTQNLNLEASVKMIVDNVKSSYECELEQIQFKYDQKAYQMILDKTNDEDLIKKFDQCLEKIHSQHFSEKEELKNQMNAQVEMYKRKIHELNEDIMRLNHLQKDSEKRHNEELKTTKKEFEDYLIEILSDYISKFALKTSIAEMDDSKSQVEKFEFELKKKTEDIAKVIRNEYENRLEDERRIMLKEFCELQKSSEVYDNAGAMDNEVLLSDEDEAAPKSNWHPELEALENSLSDKYRQQLASLAEKHSVELANLKCQYEFRLQQLTDQCGSDQAVTISNELNCEMTDSATLHALIKERDDLYKIVMNLRTAVLDIQKYLISCEDELNKTLIRSIITNYTDHDGVVIRDITDDEPNASNSETEESDSTLIVDRSKHVHFAPDVSTIIEGDFLLDCIERRHDISIEIRNELVMSLQRLKSEAAAVLGLTTSKSTSPATTRSVESRRLASVTRQLVDKNKELKDLNEQLREAKDIIYKYEQNLAEIQADLKAEKDQREKDRANSSLESVYVDREQAAGGIELYFQNLSRLQEKARTMVSQSGDAGLPLHVVSIVEEICKHVDHLLEEARKEREDLQSQIGNADKQLRGTRMFLDEQAAERECERDEFNREITKLKQQLQDKERDWMSKERFASERSAFENGSVLLEKVEALEQKVQETTNLLRETEEKKEEIDRELKEADQKVLVLKEIIRDLENQDRAKTCRQTTLEQRLDELERELESQKNDQNAMALELEAMQDGSPRDVNLKQLEEHFKKQFNPGLVDQMKSQLREMARSIQKQTKYMESLNVHVSSASLSSPSEDISIREQLDLFKCQTPEGCRSPLLSLPTDEISLLQDQLSRHTKIEEITIKRIRDQEMQLSSLQSRYEDVLAERDVLQVKCENQLSTLASTKTRLDEVRRRAEWEQTKCDAKSMEKITVLEEELYSLQNTIKNKEREAIASHQQISNLQRILADKESELCNYVDSQNNQIEFLQQKLKIMEIEKGKLKVMLNKLKEGHNMSLSALMEELLAEKNADIDHLEQMVKELRGGALNTSLVDSQNTSKKSSSSNSKGHRVSFADEVDISHPKDAERTRDAAHLTNAMQDFSPHFSSTAYKIEKTDENLITPPSLQPVLNNSINELKAGGDFAANWEVSTLPKHNIQEEELKMEIDVLKKELVWKTERLENYEKRLNEIPMLEGELKRARDDLASTISEISEDKKYYQEQLELMTELRKQLNEREAEVQELKDIIALREESLVKVTADVKSLQLILDKSQKKIEDAKKAALNGDTKKLSEEIERLKDENIRHVQEILALKKELDKISLAEVILLKESLSDEKKISEKLRIEMDTLLEEKRTITLELDASRQNCQSLRKELETNMAKLLESEKEINELRKDLESSAELNINLSKKFHDTNHELKSMSRKMSSEISNRVKKDSEDIIKMKDELDQLRCINYDLESDCEKLRIDLNNKVRESKAEMKISENRTKIEELEVEVDNLREGRNILLQNINELKQKLDTERDRCENLFSAAETYKNSESLAQEKVLKEKEMRSSAEKKTQFLKREYEKLKRTKKELEKKNTVLKDELDKEKRHTMMLESGSFKPRRSLTELQVTPVDHIEIIPNENKISGSLDDLAGQLQTELDTSARLDYTLLSTLDMQTTCAISSLPSESLVAILQKVINHGFKNLTPEETDNLYEELSLHTHRPPRIADLMKRIDKLQNQIREQRRSVEALHEELKNERSHLSKEKEKIDHLETEIDRLQKIISYQEERLAFLSETVEQNRTLVSDLKISLLKEKGNFKKLHILFEGERDKIKQIQKEDTELIEDLRICLEEEKDSKVRLQLCLEQERERLQTLESQLNAAQAIEQFVQKPPTESGHLKKCLDEWREKYTDIGVQLEREKRHVNSLTATLNKEKAECDHLRTELYNKTVEYINLQAEVEQLKCTIGKERLMNKEINDKMKTIQEAEIRRQRNRAAAEDKHKRAMERAKIQKRDLEAEVARLRTQLIAIKKGEPVSTWKDGESESLLSEIKDVNSELEKLGWEKKQLTSKVKALLDENEHLEAMIGQSAGKQISESEVSYFISLYIRSKSHRKALIWQKRYLMLSLQGYQNEGESLAMKISSSITLNKSWVPQLSVTTKASFKHAALAVIAITRMKKIMEYRKVVLGVNHKIPSPRKEHLIRQKLKLASPRNDGLSPVSSPFKEIENLNFPLRESTGKSEGLLKPTRLADYLETFNELQTRLSQALSPPDNRSIGLESKILSNVSY